jgi:methylmalonyl-CoA carboxyltransferase 5S subunit
MMARNIEVTELVLRDGHQGLLVTRMAMEDMVVAEGDSVKSGQVVLLWA